MKKKNDSDDVYVANSVLDILAQSDMSTEQFRDALTMLAESCKGVQPSNELIRVQTAIVNSCKNNTRAA